MLKHLLDLQLFTDEDTEQEPQDNQESQDEQNVDGEGQDNNEVQDDDSQDKDGQDGEEQNNSLPKTQAELDAIIKQRLQRDRKARQKSNDSKTLEDRISELEEINRNNSFENIALKQGVTEDNLARVIKLAKLEETEDINEAITNVLKDFPMFVAKENDLISTGTKVKTETQTQAEKDREIAFRKRMGLPVDE